MKQTDSVILSDTDLAGPLMFCLLFGAVLLLVTKANFVYPNNHPYVYTVREGALWLYLRCWTAGMYEYVCGIESDEYWWCFCWLCGECPWLLPAPYGTSLFFLHHRASTVSWMHGICACILTIYCLGVLLELCCRW